MTDRPIDPNDITPEMVKESNNVIAPLSERLTAEDLAAVLTCARRWKLGQAEDRVTLGDLMRWLKAKDHDGGGKRHCITLGCPIVYLQSVGPRGGLEASWPDDDQFAAEVAAWKDGKR